MPHDWICETLEDLKCYALANGLPALAAKVDEALQIARAEIIAEASFEDTFADLLRHAPCSPMKH